MSEQYNTTGSIELGSYNTCDVQKNLALGTQDPTTGQPLSEMGWTGECVPAADNPYGDPNRGWILNIYPPQQQPEQDPLYNGAQQIL